MLHRLRVQNYALIESIEVEFARGLNILTGETGAGKSLLVGAFGLIQGKRADSSLLTRSGQKCLVEAEFRFETEPATLRIFHDAAWYEPDVYKQLIIRREILPSGKSRAFINDTPALLEDLRAVAEELIDLHGQHEGQKIINPDRQLEALDQFAGIESERQQFALLYRQYYETAKELDSLRTKEAEHRRRVDYLNFQVEELRSAKLAVGEEEAIERELKLLHHAEQLGETLQQCIQILDRDDQSLRNRLIEQERKLSKLAHLHTRLQEESAKLEQARILIEDVASELEAIGESLELDPRRLAFLEERASIYYRLRQKYAVAHGDELIKVLEQIEKELDEINNYEEIIDNLQKKIERIKDELLPIALRLEEKRNEAATQLSHAIESILKEVGLQQAKFTIRVERLLGEGLELTKDIWANANGINRVLFHIQTNPGQPWGTLASIASGGEVSRVMLALKAALSVRINPAVMIFDEIDTGISGEVALKVGRVMEKLAETNQLLVITHLPQIAARGTKHFKIYKEVIEGNTFSRIKELNLDERINEIAMIMSGANPTANTLQSARELLSLSNS